MKVFYLLSSLLLACQLEAQTPKALPVASQIPSSPAPSAQPPAPIASPALKTVRLKLNDLIIPCEVADTPATRNQGLSGRKNLPDGHGLILAFDTPQVTAIWMPDMNFAIDVFFVRDNRILALYHDAPPCPSREDCPAFGPSEPVDYVLEVNAGSARRWQANVGDRIIRVD